MTDPAAQDLYIFQNEHGCFKVGRSIDPWDRRHALKGSEHCSIELIAAYEGGGQDEEAIHLALQSFRLVGEWFSGDEAARAALRATFVEPDPLPWKWSFDTSATEAWVARLKRARQTQHVAKAIGRELALLRSGIEPHWAYDSSIHHCRLLAIADRGVTPTPDEVPGPTQRWVSGPSPHWERAIPAYTSDVAAALLVWPKEARPPNWDDTPIACCIAGLIALRRTLPKHRVAGKVD